MRADFVEAFDALDVDEKRNQLNNEMESSYELLQLIKRSIDCNVERDEAIQNYHMADDADLTESEMLTRLYFDFYIIQRNILDVADKLMRENQTQDF